MAKDIERNFSGTNFVVRTLAVLVALVIVAWLAVHYSDTRKEVQSTEGTNQPAEEAVPHALPEKSGAKPSVQ